MSGGTTVDLSRSLKNMFCGCSLLFVLTAPLCVFPPPGGAERGPDGGAELHDPPQLPLYLPPAGPATRGRGWGPLQQRSAEAADQQRAHCVSRAGVRTGGLRLELGVGVGGCRLGLVIGCWIPSCEVLGSNQPIESTRLLVSKL